MMIDGRNTTKDWQLHAGDICVLPVGSVEQHSEHLPLLTDVLQAEYFSRMVAEDLEAALLPVQPYANCLEHSGFRGAVTLRPETLMQVIRDIADEMERQHFRILILLNGHGGNFSLLPAVRDINRMDRPLKILLVNFWEYSDPNLATDSAKLGAEIHAGEWETSLMLALYPEWVRGRGPDRIPPAPEPHPLQRSDLTTFGVGHFNPTGAVGFPSFADPAKGQAIVQSIRERMLPSVRDRVQRLRRNRHYAGAGGIAVRTLVAADMEAVMRLKTLAGWNQTEEDWCMLTELAPQGCLVAVRNGAVVGSATAVDYAGMGWIGMVLVDPEFRRLGIGRRLLEAALVRLQGCRAVRLDATPFGKKLYDTLGFRDEFVIHRVLCRMAPSAGAGLPAAEPARTEDLPAIAALDARVFGSGRAELLQALYRRGPELARVVRRGNRVSAFVLGRTGSAYPEIGPMVAERPEEAQALAWTAWKGLNGGMAFLDVPAGQEVFLRWVLDVGGVVQRSFQRMVRGVDPAPAAREGYALAGPELG